MMWNNISGYVMNLQNVKIFEMILLIRNEKN